MSAPAQTLNNRGHFLGDKTFAFTGYHQFRSGWTSPLGRFASVPLATIRRNSRLPFPTHTFDGNDPGQFYASHAELQAWHMQPGNPIIVTRPVCESCQKQFQALATHTHSAIYVGSPLCIHEFLPNQDYTRSSSRGLREAHGVDANGNNWRMTPVSGGLLLRTDYPNHESTSASVSSERSGVFEHYNPEWGWEIARYYPDKNTEIETKFITDDRVHPTHSGPSNGAYDIINGVRDRIKPRDRM